MTNKITFARVELGQYFQQRRVELGHSQHELADMVGLSASTVNGIETGRFAWDIDLQHRLCAALEITPFFAAGDMTEQNGRKWLQEDNPERYHGYYITENLLLYPDQMALTKFTYPRLFVRFNYGDSYFASYAEWVANIAVLEWLDKDDKPTDPAEIETILTDCWNFLALHEQEEERLANEIDEDEE